MSHLNENKLTYIFRSIKCVIYRAIARHKARGIPSHRNRDRCSNDRAAVHQNVSRLPLSGLRTSNPNQTFDGIFIITL